MFGCSTYVLPSPGDMNSHYVICMRPYSLTRYAGSKNANSTAFIFTRRQFIYLEYSPPINWMVKRNLHNRSPLTAVGNGNNGPLGIYPKRNSSWNRMLDQKQNLNLDAISSCDCIHLFRLVNMESNEAWHKFDNMHIKW